MFLLKKYTFSNIFNCVGFEFDSRKSDSNKLKHGIDFHEAQALWNKPIIQAGSYVRSNEERFAVCGKIQGIYWTAIITLRKEIIRIISVRKSRTNEKEIYKRLVEDSNNGEES